VEHTVAQFVQNALQASCGLIPDGVNKTFHWHNLAGCTMALGSDQPLQERLPGIFPGG